jgi:acetyl esterase/lipase
MVALAACAQSSSRATLPDSAASAATACPVFNPGPLPGGPPGGATQLPIASTVAPSDTSTSIVLHVDGDAQMTCTAMGRTSQSDIVYSSPRLADGTTLPLQLDLLAPVGSTPRPLVVFVPGGGFVTAVKQLSLDVRSYVADAGFVVASIQYRTIMNGALYSDGVKDVKAAIRFLRANATRYGIDPGAVAVWGQSAGGYLVAMVGTTNGLPEFEAGDHLEQSSEVQAVVDEFGASDLTRIAADFDAAVQAYYRTPDNFVATYILGPGSGKALADAPGDAEKANPIHYVDSSDPPFLLEHGSRDTIISPSQTLLLHTALRAAHVDSLRYVLEGANHGDLAFLGDPSAGLPWTTTTAANTIVSFLKGKLTR